MKNMFSNYWKHYLSSLQNKMYKIDLDSYVFTGQVGGIAPERQHTRKQEIIEKI